LEAAEGTNRRDMKKGALGKKLGKRKMKKGLSFTNLLTDQKEQRGMGGGGTWRCIFSKLKFD